jgi:hypothetical protein
MSLLLELMKICNILCMFLNNPKLGLGSMFSLQTIFGSFLFPFVLFVICIYLLVSNMISISRVAFLVYQ